MNSQKIMLYEKKDAPSKKTPFSKFIKEGRLNLNPPLSTKELAARLEINYEQFRKILNFNRKTDKRDCILAICAVLKFDSDETNKALDLYSMPKLNTEDDRDDELINIIEEQLTNYQSIKEINQRLERNNFSPLDIIDHKPSDEKTSYINTRYKVMERKVQTYSNDLFYGDQYNSLITAYSPNNYRCDAITVLYDSEKKVYYELTATTENQFFIKDQNVIKTKIPSSKLDEYGDLKYYFNDLLSKANRELKKLLCILNDTKNYKIRCSAGIKNDAFHIYAETYNYSIPELNEYYIFEYVDNNQFLSVYNTSHFMSYYLSEKEYSSYFKKSSDPLETYASIEELESMIDGNSHNKNLLSTRLRHFKILKENVDSLQTDLKNRKQFVRNLDYIYEDKDRVCQKFDVLKEFDCSYIGEFSDIIIANKNSADFTINGSKISITLDDLYRAFELGFNDINEICRVKIKLGSIDSIIY